MFVENTILFHATYLLQSYITEEISSNINTLLKKYHCCFNYICELDDDKYNVNSYMMHIVNVFKGS